MNAKQVDAAGFLMRVTSHAAVAWTELDKQMTEEEAAAVIAVRDLTTTEVNNLLAKFAERRSTDEAQKLALEQAAAEEAAKAAAAKQKELEELKAAAEAKAKADEAAAQAQAEIDALKKAEETKPAEEKPAEEKPAT